MKMTGQWDQSSGAHGMNNFYGAFRASIALPVT